MNYRGADEADRLGHTVFYNLTPGPDLADLVPWVKYLVQYIYK